MTEPLRVALVGDYPLGDGPIGGGVEAAFAYLVRALARLGDVEPHVLTFGVGGARPRTLARDGATVHVMEPFRRFELARNFSGYRAYLTRVLREIDPHVVHAQGATDHAYAVLHTELPAVVTVHGVLREDAKHQPTLRLTARKRLYALLIERYNIRHTRHLIAIGRYVTDYFARDIRAGTSIHYIRNAVDDEYFDLPPHRGEGIVLYAGRVIRRKRPLDLVTAFAALASDLPTAQLRLAGDVTSDPAYVQQLRDAIAASHLHDRVHLLGPLPDVALRQEFAACDVLALPSSQETAPMVIGQAMAARKPVIGTPVGAVPEMIADGVTGYVVDVGDVRALSDRVRSLLGNAALMRRLGDAARVTAEREYRASAVAAQTRDVYRSVAGAAAGR